MKKKQISPRVYYITAGRANGKFIKLMETIEKKTAIKIRSEIKERLNEGIELLNCSKQKPNHDYMAGIAFGLNMYEKMLKETIKKYGVEVEK